MKVRRILPLLVLLGSSTGLSEKPIACDPNALGGSQRERHRALGEKLRGAVAGRVELANGYTLVLDLDRLPPDAAGSPFCVVEVAEWVDLESRCCPFLEFGIEVSAKSRVVRLRLSGGKGVKSFLRTELGLLDDDAGRGRRHD